jgi:ectoine hydroxylase-related dioxygenase (phytanoyl-CoA dioxygenase family)
VYASEQSPLVAELANDARLRRLVDLTRSDLQASTDRMEGIGVVIKPAGKLRGLANIPWHTDCGLGGHLIQCPSVAIGVQLTDATPETGCFEAIAGTHGASCPVPTPEDLTRWPHLLVPTKAGDVTVHIADLMHASPRPTGDGGRRTMYVSYYPPSLFEHVGPGEAYNDAIRRRTATDVADALAGR